MFTSDYREFSSSGGDITSSISSSSRSQDFECDTKQVETHPKPNVLVSPENISEHTTSRNILRDLSFVSSSCMPIPKQTEEEQHTQPQSNTATDNEYVSFLASPSKRRFVRASQNESSSAVANEANTNACLSGSEQPVTDFVRRKGLKLAGYSWLETVRARYFLYTLSLVFFLSVITYFLCPRILQAWVDGLFIVSLSVERSSQNSSVAISMDMPGMLYVTNPNYLPVILKCMQIDIYFKRRLRLRPPLVLMDHTELYVEGVGDDDGGDEIYDIFLFSMTYPFNQQHGEKLSAVRYPFRLRFVNRALDNQTFELFLSYIVSECESHDSYTVYVQFHPNYVYANTMHSISFQNNIETNVGCQTVVTPKPSRSPSDPSPSPSRVPSAWQMPTPIPIPFTNF